MYYLGDPSLIFFFTKTNSLIKERYIPKKSLEKIKIQENVAIEAVTFRRIATTIAVTAGTDTHTQSALPLL